MCGLVGVLGWMGKDEKKAFGELLYVDVLRGHHSTGVMTLSRKNEVEVLKRKGTLNKLPDLGKLIDSGERVLMGHNRHATVGGISDETAHPFKFKNVVGCHNGTLRGIWERELDGGHKAMSDSWAIFNTINNNPDVEKSVYSKVSGAMALTFYDKRSNEFNFLRNSERTLFHAFSKDNLTMFWASEEKMLDWILTRNKIKFDSIDPFLVNNLYKVKPLEYGQLNLSKEVLNPYTKPMTHIRKSTAIGGTPTNGSDSGEIEQITFLITGYKGYCAETNSPSKWVGETFKSGDKIEEVRCSSFALYAQNKFGKHLKTHLTPCNYDYKKIDEDNDLYFKASARVVRNVAGEFMYYQVIPSTVHPRYYSKHWEEIDYSESSFEKEKLDSKIDLIEDFFKIPNSGVFMHKSKFKETYDNCGYCGSDIDWEDKGDCVFGSDGDNPTVICGSCKQEPGLLALLNMESRDYVN